MVYIQSPLEENNENTSTDNQMKAQRQVVRGSLDTRSVKSLFPSGGL